MLHIDNPQYWDIYPDPLSSSFDQRLSHTLFNAGIVRPNMLITDEDRERQTDRMLALTGNTPITRHENPYAAILVKRLSANPTESHYDAGYIKLLRQLEAEGVIWPTNRNGQHGGQRVELLELSSGSAGMGFGFAARYLGFESTLLVPEELPGPRLQHLQSVNANIELTPAGYIKATSDRLREKIGELKANGYRTVIWERHGHQAIIYQRGNHRVCVVNHSAAQIMVDAFEIPAHEIADYFPRGVSPDFFVNIIGNLTSSTAMLTVLKARFPRMTAIGLEDKRNPDHFDRRYPGIFK